MPSHRDYLERFFEHLSQRDLAACDQFVGEMDTACLVDPLLQPWRDYCATIIIHERENDFGKAESLYRQLLQQPHLNDFLAGQIHVSLATVAMQLSNFDAAFDAARSAIRLFQRSDEPIEQAKARAQLGLVYQLAFNAGELAENSLAEGLAACDAALEHLRTLPINGQTHFIWVQALATRGALLCNLLDWSTAIDSFSELLIIAEAGKNTYATALAHGNLGRARRKLGGTHLPTAEANLQSALETFFTLGRAYEEMLTASELVVLYRDQQQFDQALVYCERSQQRAEIVRSGISDERARAGFIATVSDLYANAVFCAMRAEQPALAFRYMEMARSRAFLDLLKNDEADLARRAATAIPTLQEVQSLLPPDCLLLEYFTMGVVHTTDRQLQTGVIAERPVFPPEVTLLLAITAKDVQLLDVVLSPNDLNPISIDSVVEEHFLDESIRQMLYTQLIAPIAAHLPGKQTVFIIPHGPLHYLPFQALIDETGKTLLQPEGFRIVFSPSASILLHSKLLDGNRLAFSQDGSRSIPGLVVGCNGDEQNQLYYAEAEAAKIAALTGCPALIGGHAKLTHLLELAKAATILHFSCHGGFDADEPLESNLQIGYTEKLTARQILEQMQLPDSLVILSACASGLSRVHRGDELYGLVRAFLFAGASALLVTQWRVDERSTYLLMCKMYEFLMAGEDFASALQRAQLYLQSLTVGELLQIVAEIRQTHPRLEQALVAALDEMTATLEKLPTSETPFAEPYYWAPFILIYG